MPTKFKREGYRERAEALGKQRRQFSVGTKRSMRMTPSQARMALVFGILIMALLLMTARLLGPALQHRFGAVREGTAVVFAKRSYDEDTPQAQYFVGVRMEFEGNATPFEDVVAVEPEFYRQVEEGQTVRVRYSVDRETGGIHVRMVRLAAEGR